MEKKKVYKSLCVSLRVINKIIINNKNDYE